MLKLTDNSSNSTLIDTICLEAIKDTSEVCSAESEPNTLNTLFAVNNKVSSNPRLLGCPGRLGLALRERRTFSKDILNLLGKDSCMCMPVDLPREKGHIFKPVSNKRDNIGMSQRFAIKSEWLVPTNIGVLCHIEDNIAPNRAVIASGIGQKKLTVHARAMGTIAPSKGESDIDTTQLITIRKG